MNALQEYLGSEKYASVGGKALRSALFNAFGKGVRMVTGTHIDPKDFGPLASHLRDAGVSAGDDLVYAMKMLRRAAADPSITHITDDTVRDALRLAKGNPAYAKGFAPTASAAAAAQKADFDFLTDLIVARQSGEISKETAHLLEATLKEIRKKGGTPNFADMRGYMNKMKLPPKQPPPSLQPHGMGAAYLEGAMRGKGFTPRAMHDLRTSLRKFQAIHGEIPPHAIDEMVENISKVPGTRSKLREIGQSLKERAPWGLGGGALGGALAGGAALAAGAASAPIAAAAGIGALGGLAAGGAPDKIWQLASKGTQQLKRHAQHFTPKARADRYLSQVKTVREQAEALQEMAAAASSDSMKGRVYDQLDALRDVYSNKFQNEAMKRITKDPKAALELTRAVAELDRTTRPSVVDSNVNKVVKFLQGSMPRRPPRDVMGIRGADELASLASRGGGQMSLPQALGSAAAVGGSAYGGYKSMQPSSDSGTYTINAPGVGPYRYDPRR